MSGRKSLVYFREILHMKTNAAEGQTAGVYRAFVSAMVLITAFSGCYQSKTYGHPFPKVVSHLSKKYTTDLTKTGGRTIHQQLTYSSVNVIEYKEGSKLRFKAFGGFIGKTKEFVKVTSLPGDRTKVSVDFHSSFMLIPNRRRADEREFLVKLGIELDSVCIGRSKLEDRNSLATFLYSETMKVVQDNSCLKKMLPLLEDKRSVSIADVGKKITVRDIAFTILDEGGVVQQPVQWTRTKMICSCTVNGKLYRFHIPELSDQDFEKIILKVKSLISVDD